MELVDSVDELRTSSSISGISMPNFEVLDACKEYISYYRKLDTGNCRHAARSTT